MAARCMAVVVATAVGRVERVIRAEKLEVAAKAAAVMAVAQEATSVTVVCWADGRPWEEGCVVVVAPLAEA